MKKYKIILILALCLTMITSLVGCGNSTADNREDGDKPIKITLAGFNFGDKSYWDSAADGLRQAKEKHGDRIEINIVDMTNDIKKHKNGLLDVSDSGSDLIITGSWQMAEILQEVAPMYPHIKYVIFDTHIDNSSGDYNNIYSMGYTANESGYLAGVIAAYITSSDNQGAYSDKRIGFIGGRDNSEVIYDFLVGYIQGAQSVISDIKVSSTYVGSFSDTAKAKELALAQFNTEKVDIILSAAGASGIGVIEAAAETGRYVIGVDSDQSILYEDNKRVQQHIATSALKRVDNSIFNLIDRYLADEIPFGSYELLGLQEGAVGIVMNDITRQYLTEEQISNVEQAMEDIASNKITVKSAKTMSNEEIISFINSVK